MVEFYKNLYTADCEPLNFDLRAGSYLDCLASKLAMLSKPFSLEEVYADMFNVDPSKALDSDECLAGLYQKS